ncbi:MAG: DUF2203 domain-containing protein [Planctomycetota bacterium]
MAKRKFTPTQANRTLPLVKRIVADLLSKGAQLRELTDDEGRPASATTLEALEEEVQELMAELEGVGCYYKDWNFEKGLVDFPAEIDGESVLLCWSSDEPAVTWYHTYEDGYAGRKEIPTELLED